MKEASEQSKKDQNAHEKKDNCRKVQKMICAVIAFLLMPAPKLHPRTRAASTTLALVPLARRRREAEFPARIDALLSLYVQA
jgi:hypothetical protein